MPSSVTRLFAAGILLGPQLSVVGLVVWARRLRMRGAPRFAVWAAYLLSAAVGGLVIVAGYLGAVIVATHPVGGSAVEPSRKARALAEGISETMNCGGARDARRGHRRGWACGDGGDGEHEADDAR